MTRGQVGALALAAGLAVIALSRLPQLLGGGVLLDGDEAIVGLMAEHLRRDGTFPWFFWGQGYGLATLEAGVGALSFSLLGTSAVSLKIAALTIWSAGWAMFTLALLRLAPGRPALGGGLLLALCPAWFAWSTMARGGYVTAFLTSGAALFVFAGLHRDDRSALLRMAALGLWTGLTYLAQPIWILTLGPFLALLAWQRRTRLAELATLAGTAVAVVVAIDVAAGAGEGYWAPLLLRNVEIGHALMELPGRLQTFWSGVYSFNQAPADLAASQSAGAALWNVVTALVFVAAVRDAFARRAAVGVAAAAGLLIVVAFTLVIDRAAFGFRYFLPIAGCVICALVTTPVLDRRWIRELVVLLLAIFGASAAMSSRDANRFGPHAERVATLGHRDAAIRRLLADGYRHAYCLDPLLQWQLMFASREQIVARWIDPGDRHPEYPRAVDAALRNGQPVALIGAATTWEQVAKVLGPEMPLPVVKAGPLGWIAKPSPQLLQRLSFRLNP